MPELAEASEPPELAEDVAAFLAKFDEDAQPSEAFPLMEVPGFSLEHALTACRVVELADRGMDDDDATLLGKALLAFKAPKARTLTLTRNLIGDAGVVGLSPSLAAMPLLEELVLAKNRVSDAGLAAIAQALAAQPTLKRLVLSDNSIGDAGVASLASAVGAGGFAPLVRLYLDRNPIGDAGAEALAAVLIRMDELEWLALQRCAIGAAGMGALTAAVNKGALSNAEYLYTQEQTVPVPEAAIAALKKVGAPPWRSAPSPLPHRTRRLRRPRVRGGAAAADVTQVAPAALPAAASLA